MKLFFVILFTLVLNARADAAPSGFCWAQLSSGVYCTQIAYSPSVFLLSYQCKQYAAGMGAGTSGYFRNTDVNALQQKQEEGCNYVANNPKYSCFLEERCETSGGVTSSLSPINRSVFSPSGDADLARKACLARAPEAYLDAMTSAPLECLVGARAVMTIPKQ